MKLDSDFISTVIAGFVPFLSVAVPPLTDLFALFRTIFFAYTLYDSLASTWDSYAKTPPIVSYHIIQLVGCLAFYGHEWQKGTGRIIDDVVEEVMEYMPKEGGAVSKYTADKGSDDKKNSSDGKNAKGDGLRLLLTGLCSLVLVAIGVGVGSGGMEECLSHTTTKFGKFDALYPAISDRCGGGKKGERGNGERGRGTKGLVI